MYAHQHDVALTLADVERDNEEYRALGTVLMGDGKNHIRRAGYFVHHHTLMPRADGGDHLMYSPQVSGDGTTWHHGWDSYDEGLYFLCPRCAVQWLKDREAGCDHDVVYRLIPST